MDEIWEEPGFTMYGKAYHVDGEGDVGKEIEEGHRAPQPPALPLHAVAPAGGTDEVVERVAVHHPEEGGGALVLFWCGLI